MNEDDFSDLQKSAHVQIISKLRLLERAVLSLVATHPNKPALLAEFQKHIELDTADHLYRPWPEDAMKIIEKERAKLLKAITGLCS